MIDNLIKTLSEVEDLLNDKIREKTRAESIRTISAELQKDNSVKPFGENVYNTKANIKRKIGRTGEEHEGLGRNVAVKEWATGGRESAKSQVARQAKVDKVKSAKNPVKVFTDEEKKALQDKMEAEANAKKMG